jgi:hypothetical protein
MRSAGEIAPAADKTASCEIYSLSARSDWLKSDWLSKIEFREQVGDRKPKARDDLFPIQGIGEFE